jgi:hypothetical protein
MAASKILQKTKGETCMKFSATYIEPYTNSTTANVIFADPETDPDTPSVLSFSRPIEPGFEDSAYYFEINEQSYGSYKGLDMVKLTRNNVTIRVSDHVIEKFQEEDFREVRVEFEADDELYALVVNTMQVIFKGFDTLTVE